MCRQLETTYEHCTHACSETQKCVYRNTERCRRSTHEISAGRLVRVVLLGMRREIGVLGEVMVGDAKGELSSHMGKLSYGE
jgi:hypothetical protein